MRRNEKTIKAISLFILFLLPFIKLVLAGLWAAKGNYIYAGMAAIASIIWVTIFSTVLVCVTIKSQIGEMKKLINEYCKNDQKESDREKDKTGI